MRGGFGTGVLLWIAVLLFLSTAAQAQADEMQPNETQTSETQTGEAKKRAVSRSMTASPQSLSPKEFFGKPAYRQISLSPGGRYLAIVEDAPFEEAYKRAMERRDAEAESRNVTISLAPETYGDQLLIFDLEAEQFVSRIPFFENEIFWLHWASESRLLISLSSTYGVKINYKVNFQLPSVRTISLDWKNASSVLLFGDDRSIQRQNLSLSRFVDPLGDDPDHVLMAAYKNGDLDLWRVNVVTGESDRVGVGVPSTFAWIADRNGMPMMRLDKNRSGSVMTVMARDDQGRFREVRTVPLSTNDETSYFMPVAKGDAPNEIYVIATPEGEGAAAIMAYDAQRDAFTKKVAEAGPYDISGALTDPNTNEYLAALYIEDGVRYIFKDETLQRHMDGVQTFFGDKENVEMVAASREKSKIILLATSPVNSGEIYIYDTARRRIDPLMVLRPNLPADVLSPVEVIRYPARDGLEITGYLTHPRGAGESGYAPLVMLPHGGPGARDKYDFDPLAQFLASRGYRVFQPNFRGSSGYGADFLKAGFREWGGKMHEDVMDGLAVLKERGLASPDRTCIVGWSYGGYEALYASMADPEAFACAASIAGVSDLITLLNSEKKDRTLSKEGFAQLVERIGDPKADKAMLVARSPARHPKALTKPLLIMHGKLDAVSPYEQSYDLMKALDDAGVEYEWRVFVDDHSLSAPGSTVQAMHELEDFLSRHLKR